MASYYVNAKAEENGDHEVHAVGCQSMPAASNRVYLGEYNSGLQAVAAAKIRYSRSKACPVCMTDDRAN